MTRPEALRAARELGVTDQAQEPTAADVWREVLMKAQREADEAKARVEALQQQLEVESQAYCLVVNERDSLRNEVRDLHREVKVWRGHAQSLEEQLEVEKAEASYQRERAERAEAAVQSLEPVRADERRRVCELLLEKLRNWLDEAHEEGASRQVLACIRTAMFLVKRAQPLPLENDPSEGMSYDWKE